MGRAPEQALNVGENFRVSLPAWAAFATALPATAVAFLYVSEHHLGATNLKQRMRDAIRANRRRAPVLGASCVRDDSVNLLQRM